MPLALGWAWLGSGILGSSYVLKFGPSQDARYATHQRINELTLAMPRYTGKDLSVRLSTNKLQETCPAPSKAVSVRKTNLEKISAGLQGKDATLAERYIRIDSDGLALHYLEPDHGIPFYLVGPGFALDDIQGAGFCITVSLSELCFGSKRLEKNDVKIE